MNKSTWFSNFLSIEETKTSTLVICLLGLIGFGCFMYINTGEFNSELASLIEILILSIAGNNIATTISVNRSSGNSVSSTNNGTDDINNWV